MSSEVLAYSIFAAAIIGGLCEIGRRVPRRRGADVLSDLKSVEGPAEGAHLRGQRDFSLDDPLAQYGLFGAQARRRFGYLRFLVPCGMGAAMLLVRLLLVPTAIAGHVVLVLGAVALGYLMQRRNEAARKREYERSIEFYLPVVMERLVMGAQAGLDILPAIRAILEVDGIEDDQMQRARLVDDTYDPVSKLLLYAYRLTEAGLSFDQALGHVAERVESAPLRHAFIHLAVSHREGGELVGPLRELSDATQLYLQESVEEEIARMPVRATLPLVLTFAGLLVFFLASPLLQILDFISKAKVG